LAVGLTVVLKEGEVNSGVLKRNCYFPRRYCTQVQLAAKGGGGGGVGEREGERVIKFPY
jgi:hypothetical protein